MAKRVDIGVLQRLSELNGPAGFEGPVRDYISGLVEELGGKVEVDKLGNVHCHVEGKGPKVMLIAHMDEIGLITADVDEQGFIYFSNLGGWDVRLLPGLEVTVMAPGRDLPGTIGMKPPHITTIAEREKVVDMSELFVDTGLDAGHEDLAGKVAEQRNWYDGGGTGDGFGHGTHVAGLPHRRLNSADPIGAREASAARQRVAASF